MSRLTNNGYHDSKAGEPTCRDCMHLSRDWNRCMHRLNHERGKLCPIVIQYGKRKVCNLFADGKRVRNKPFVRKGAQSGMRPE